MPRPFSLFIIVMVLAIAALAAVMVQRSGGWEALWSADDASAIPTRWSSGSTQPTSSRTMEQQTGSHFTPVPADPYASPEVELLSFDGFAGANAI